MERWNSEGIPRDDLKWALGQRRVVRKAVETKSCMLCKATSVNEAGLCDVCWAFLSEEELALASKWLSGQGASGS